jgi:dihydrofolate reductase
MRKLKLQMQFTVDGHVAGPEGQLDWMAFDMDPELLAFINQLTDTSDTILMGRKMTEGFVKYWEQVVTQKDSPEYDFAQKMVALPMIEQGLIDEMNLFVNPVAIGNGMRIFKGRKPLKLAASKGYPCGIVVNSYLPK